MSKKVEKLSPQEVEKIAESKQTILLRTTLAEKTIAEARLAEAEHQNLIKQIFLINRLDIKCTIDDDGVVTWPEEEKPAETPAETTAEKPQETANAN